MTDRLILGLHAGTIHDLPDASALGGLPAAEQYGAIRDAGLGLVQDGDDALARAAGLQYAGMARVVRPGEVEQVARAAAGRGYHSVTLHVGTGFESDGEADALVAAILDASAAHRIPLYVETHRATVTQDPWRTLQLIERHPGVRFTGDFSHWYTGVELVYGDLDAKLDALQPVFERVRFLHGRIGTPGSIQVHVGDGKNRPYVQHFREVWSRVFEAFLRRADPDEQIVFAPELLSAANYYALQFRDATGKLVEEGDRWEQALVLCRLAQESFAEARRRVSPLSAR